MALSGTFSFLPTVDVLLAEAWERCGKASEVMGVQAAEAGIRSLQFLLLHWQNLGPRLWTIERVTIPLVAGVASYTAPAATIDLLEVGLSVLGEDIRLTGISRDQYADLGDKATEAQPSQYWVNRALPLPVVTLYPTPDTAYTLWANRIRQPMDVDALQQEPEIPVLWADAVAAELARRLAVKFAPERLEVLTADAQRAYIAARRESRERVPLTITVRMS
jgi:hypothetical protein